MKRVIEDFDSLKEELKTSNNSIKDSTDLRLRNLTEYGKYAIAINLFRTLSNERIFQVTDDFRETQENSDIQLTIDFLERPPVNSFGSKTLPNYLQLGIPYTEQAVFDFNHLIVDNYKCYILHYKERFKFIHPRLLFQQTFGVTLFLYFKRSIRVSDYYLVPRSKEWTFGSQPRLSNLQLRSGLYLSHSTYETHLLRPPYKTRCRVYEDSRAACLHACVKETSIRLNNTIPDKYNTYSRDSARRMTISDKLSLDEYQYIKYDLWQQLQELCETKCMELDCQSVVHMPRITSAGDHKRTLMYIQAASTPVIQAFTQPAIPLISFLTGIIATFGFWLGLSIFELPPQVTDWGRDIFKYRQRKLRQRDLQTQLLVRNTNWSDAKERRRLYKMGSSISI